MAKINTEGSAFKSKLYVSATAHTDVSALTESTIETFTTATGTKQVKYPGDITGLGNVPEFVTAGQLGRAQSKQIEVQGSPSTLTFDMVGNPTDDGQSLMLAGGTSELGYVLVVDVNGGLRYKAFNGITNILEDITTGGAYNFATTIAVADYVKTVDDSA